VGNKTLLLLQTSLAQLIWHFMPFALNCVQTTWVNLCQSSALAPVASNTKMPSGI